MTISIKGIELLKEFEGLRLTAYKCVAGAWTVGYGHRCENYTEISAKRAEQLLYNDLYYIERLLQDEKYIKTQCQYDALCSLIFNIGIAAFKTSTLRKFLKEGRNIEDIRSQWLRWVYVKGSFVEGLKRRREREFLRFIDFS